jgi:hypothetical protein
MTFRIGVDIGGTFADFVALDDDNKLYTLKVSTTPDKPGGEMPNRHSGKTRPIFFWTKQEYWMVSCQRMRGHFRNGLHESCSGSFRRRKLQMIISGSAVDNDCLLPVPRSRSYSLPL